MALLVRPKSGIPREPRPTALGSGTPYAPDPPVAPSAPLTQSLTHQMLHKTPAPPL